MVGCQVDLTWKGWTEVFLVFANMYLKRIVLAEFSKSLNKDLFELETGGAGINLQCKASQKKFNLVV